MKKAVSQLGALSVLLLVAGCGEVVHARGPHSGCVAKRGATALTLHLSSGTTPKLTAVEGSSLLVVSSYGDDEMSFAQPHPQRDVCLVRERRLAHGATLEVVRLLRPGRVHFAATEATITPEANPYIQGFIKIVHRHGE